MYDARGIGLAANQVDLPFRLFVINTTSDPDQTDQEKVFINPVLDSPKGTSDAEEGCLSIPNVLGIVSRPSHIHVTAFDLSGNKIDFVADGLLGRAIQHEHDHLEGILFIDRLSESARRQIDGELEAFELDFASQRASGNIPDDEKIAQRLAEFESKYC